MRTHRSIRWALVVAPALLLATGCENNEKNLNTQGTTTSPQAVSTTEESLKKGAEPAAKPSTPSSYPGAGRRR